jgi:hypothetical protein
VSALSLYLWLKLDSLIGLGVFVGLFSCLLLLLARAQDLGMLPEDVQQFVLKFTRGFATAAVVGFLIAVFVPSSKQFALMYVIPKISESKIVQQDVPELYQLAYGYLKVKLSSTEK